MVDLELLVSPALVNEMDELANQGLFEARNPITNRPRVTSPETRQGIARELLLRRLAWREKGLRSYQLISGRQGVSRQFVYLFSMEVEQALTPAVPVMGYMR